MTLVMLDPKILTTQQAADARGCSQRAMEVWRKKNDPTKPPFVREGSGKRAPVYYHADLIQPGSYAVGGLVDTFPEPLGKTAPEPADPSSPRVLELLEGIARKLKSEKRVRREIVYTETELAEEKAAMEALDALNADMSYKQYEKKEGKEAIRLIKNSK